MPIFELPINGSVGVPMISILLADDHDLVRLSLRQLLEAEEGFSVVAEVATGEEAYTAYFKYKPDVVLLDISMPGEGGLSTMRRLFARDEHAKVLALSMFDDAAIVVRALEQGAKGYLSKGASPEVLMQAVRNVDSGKPYIEARLQDKLQERSPGEVNPLQALTGREFEVFSLLAEGLTVNEIAGLLHLSSKTVGAHHTSIMKKLELKNSAQLVRVAITWGLVRI